MTGFIQVYTGEGKGKTTAALGLALRACGAGLRVYMAQFLKKGDFSEISAIRKNLSSMAVEQFGSGNFVRKEPSIDDLKLARKGKAALIDALSGGEYDMVIADEINSSVGVGVISVKDVLDVIDAKPGSVELILTGRDAADEVLAAADLVTEMREVKHYFNDGVPSRKGIEY